MKTSTCILRLLLFSFVFLLVQGAFGQQMLNPQDSVINYDSTSPPAQPVWGKIGKWVRTPKMTWNTNAYKCYIYKGCDFRLHFPQTYKPGDGKKYPILIFYHGNGEEGPIYDNELPLKNGALIFHNAEVNGVFDGYILFMQNEFGWGPAQYTAIPGLIDSLVQEYGGDPYRVTSNGLSGGGQAVTNQLVMNPTYFSGAIPMSAAIYLDATPADVNTLKYTPIWNLDGGRDTAPSPAEAQSVAYAYQSAGANYIYKNYPTLAHDTWDSTWLEPNFWPFLNTAYLSNPWPLYGKTTFCPGQIINVTIGVVPGLAGYQWRMNGTVISGATGNSLVVTQAGTYDARVLRGSTWSDWSHIPVQFFSQMPVPVDTVVQPGCTVGTGSIIVTLPKSVGLTYSIDGIHYQVDAAFPKLEPGTYTITVQNGTTCSSPSTTAVVNPQPSTPAQPTVTITQPSCTVPKATIVLTSSDTGIVYSLNDGTTYGPTHQFYRIPAGTYWPRVKNSAGCTSAFMISIVNPQPATPAAPAINTTQPSCTVPTGTVLIASPIDTLQYSINDTIYQTGADFSGLTAGSYPVTAENSAGCVSSTVTAVIQAALGVPTVPTFNILQPTCSSPTGTVIITSPGETGFLYSDDGKTYQPDTTMGNLAPGSYELTVKNDSGCISSPVSAVVLNPSASCNMVVNVYPNPYSSEVSFNIISPESGKGVLLFYNLLGERMATTIETDFTAWIPATISCPMSFAHRQAVMYIFTIGKNKFQGTLLPEKY